MKLAHYSAEPLGGMGTMDPAAPYPWGEERVLKPNGLWVSDDDAENNWLDWSIAESFRLDTLKWRTEVIPRDAANLLLIKSVDELDAFSDEYGFDLLASLGHRLPRPAVPEALAEHMRRMDNGYIRWNRVGEKYDGIIITPYLWERRLDGGIWYYGWDCASGCIWNADAIELMPSEPFNVDEYAKKRAREEAA